MGGGYAVGNEFAWTRITLAITTFKEDGIPLSL
jgi:hypothetical protein